MNFNWQVEGGEELARRLNALPETVGKKTMEAALKMAADPIQTTASQMAPRETGALALNIRTNVIPASRSGRDSERDFAVKVGPTKNVYYGFFQEHGTVRHGAKPFMRPAFDRHAGTSLGILGQRLWEAIRKQAEGSGAGVGGRFL